MYNKTEIDKIIDASGASIGASYTKQNEIKSQRIDVISTANDELNITEPSSPTHGEYLYNRADQSQSGHLREVDDTPGAERIMEMHRSGTFYEIHPDGTRVLRVYGDNFEIALSDNTLVVGGDLNITVQGDANILTKGNTKHKIGGDYSLVVHGDMSTRVEGTRIDYTKGSHDIQSAEHIRIRSEGITDIFAQEAYSAQSAGNISFDAGGDMIHHTSGKATMTTGSSWNVCAGDTANIDASGNVYLDGSEVHFNLPGAGVTGINPDSNDPVDRDPTGGLTIEDSVIEPSAVALAVIGTTNDSLMNIISNESTLPRDRIQLY